MSLRQHRRGATAVRGTLLVMCTSMGAAAGCHGHHEFKGAAGWATEFEAPERDAWQRPDLVLDRLGLEPGHHVADIGSATGYFAVRLARRVPAGRVWGVDVEPDMVRFLNERAGREGLGNLFSVLGTAEEALLPEPVDVVLMVDTYHHISDRSDYFRRLLPRLRPGARLAIVDFRKGDLPMGPPDAMKVAPEQVETELAAAGYRLAGRVDDLPYQYVLVFSAVPTAKTP